MIWSAYSDIEAVKIATSKMLVTDLRNSLSPGLKPVNPTSYPPSFKIIAAVS